MIHDEKEYAEAVERIAQEKQRLATQKATLKAMGLGSAEIKRALDPMVSFHQQLGKKAHSYERLKRGEFDDANNLRGLGPLLVSLRIARGLTQRQLAEKPGVHESQVSRDERNEYHSVTVKRTARILDALGAEVRSHVELSEGISSSLDGSLRGGLQEDRPLCIGVRCGAVRRPAGRAGASRAARYRTSGSAEGLVQASTGRFRSTRPALAGRAGFGPGHGARPCGTPAARR